MCVQIIQIKDDEEIQERQRLFVQIIFLLFLQ